MRKQSIKTLRDKLLYGCKKRKITDRISRCPVSEETITVNHCSNCIFRR